MPSQVLFWSYKYAISSEKIATWKEVTTNGVPSISVLHSLVNLYLHDITQQKCSAYKTAETHQVQIQPTLSDTLQLFYFCSEKW